MKNVAYELPEYVRYNKIWTMIQDCIEGKVKNEKYIFPLVPTGDDDYDEERNRDYRKRAVYYNFVQRTHAGLVGQMFYRDPQVEVTPKIQVIIDDSDSSGTPLLDQVAEAASHTMSKGRYFLLVDYPKMNRAATQAEITAGVVRPNILLYKPEQLINWRVDKVRGKKRLTLVVLRETYVDDDDGFQESCNLQYRVLRLTEEGYTMEVWRLGEAENGRETWQQNEESFILDGKGQRWDEIPGIVGGVTNNDPDCDIPPLQALAELNLGHLRNSADLEEALHMMGQPTPWASGITAEHKDSVMGDEPVRFGSRSFVLLPEGGQAGLLTMPDASPIASQMEAKEKRAASLGAKLIEAGQAATTATFTNRASMAEDSVLSKAAKNISAAYTLAFAWCQRFLNDSGKCELMLSTDYDFNKMTSQERQVLMAEWQAGGITDEEYRWNLRRSGIAYAEDSVWEKEKQEKEDKAKEEAKENGVDLDRDEEE